MSFVCLNLASVALLAFCTVCQTFGTAPATIENSDAFCLIQWQVATDVATESNRPKKEKEQKLENFKCGNHAWCSGLKKTVKKVTELQKVAPTVAPTKIPREEILQPLTHKHENVADLHKEDETKMKLKKAQEDLAVTEKAMTAAKEKSGINDASVAKWKRFAKHLTKEKESLKTTLDDLTAENEAMKDNITRVTRDKEQAQEVALVIANQWRNNARTLTSTNKELFANITKLTAEKQQLLEELEKATSDKHQAVAEKDEAAVEFKQAHESDHATLEEWKQYADRLTKEKQELNDAIAKLASDKTQLESSVTNFNQAFPKMSLEDGSQDATEFRQRLGPESSVMPISYAQQPRYQQDPYPRE